MKVPKEFKFFYSCDISLKYKIKICGLKGKKERENAPETINKWLEDPFLKNSSLYKDKPIDIYICCTLYSNGKPLCSPEQTIFMPFRGDDRWDQYITIPIRHQDLPFDTKIVITIWDVYAPLQKIPIGGTCFNVFGRSRVERKGRHKLFVYQNTQGNDDTTPGQIVGKDELYRLEKLIKRYERNLIPHVDWLDKFASIEIDKISKNSDSLNKNSLYLTIELPEFELPVLFKQQTCQLYKSIIQTQKRQLVIVNDNEISDHPCEQKYHRLNVYSYDKDKDHKDLKPNSSELRLLNKLIKTPPNTHFTPIESLLVWKFRYFLSNNKKALTKFLRSVEWNETIQKNEANLILPKWEAIDVADALELLSNAFTQKNTIGVRRYAVDILRKADDEELLYYLLQLVQATKYEMIETNYDHSSESPLISFLIERASKNFKLASRLYWYITVDSVLKKSSFCNHYKTVGEELHRSLSRDDQQKITRQSQFISRLAKLSEELKAMNILREKKIEKLKYALSDGDYKDLSDFPPLPLPVDPSIEVIGIIPDKSTIYKSAKSPLGLKLKTKSGPEYGIIFKTGDDMRQDQLIIQLISLMDRLLKKENLDLKLTPYQVLATAEEDGVVEMVQPSEAMASVLNKYDGEILKYFKVHHPDPEAPLGITAEVLDTFVKSCAGYCVITYILGIGDRHLDNLLLTPNGNLFHIDFGYILGKDPKILPPPMKLCKEMVIGMGGENSKHYGKFKQLCCEAYNILRNSSHLIINLFALMIDANIPTISEEREKSILRVQEKLQLELTDQEAANSLLQLLNDSVSALFPVVVEYVHKWYQYWRN
ncbi:phosphatidylinositol 3-kinase [Cavenderia fasciculata]|uniref:phosphatidylinositol 3-kinase n=1 Tax=Cavenderia fasciculata TaxID=261658 RepID=F4QET8_CACFS|nr:phosphatidylinositol 3-kinase [Cavenderia fasciculata]EGG14145.1 phosphatidylinositol 3-kinase [Cavenderia fasciculata]|eukprot:XP_004350853.1 phosphatidylinositol 3-kinase [Cavenderia fasciculata]